MLGSVFTRRQRQPLGLVPGRSEFLGARSLAPLAGRLDQPVENSVASFRERRGWLVSVLFEGVRGLGEASPLSVYSSDPAEQTEAALRALGSTLEVQADTLEAFTRSVLEPSARLPREAYAARFGIAATTLRLSTIYGSGRTVPDIIGKLIAAGTGMMRYREFDVAAPDYQPMAYFSSEAAEDPAAWLSNIHGTYSTDEPEPAVEA